MTDDGRNIDLNLIREYSRKISECLSGYNDISVTVTEKGFDLFYNEDFYSEEELYNKNMYEEYLDDKDINNDSPFAMIKEEFFKDICDDFGNFDTYSAKCKDCYRKNQILNCLCEIEKFS
jgi:hypothetical protein